MRNAKFFITEALFDYFIFDKLSVGQETSITKSEIYAKSDEIYNTLSTQEIAQITDFEAAINTVYQYCYAQQI